MESKIYCGASSHHIHCENYDFKVGEILKIFGNEKADERTTWLDLRNCTGTIDSTSLSLLPGLDYLNITGSCLEILPKAFACLPKLNSLDFRKTKISITKEIFEDCTVKHLLLEELSVPDECFSYLKNLDYLVFESCKFKKFDRNTLKNLSSLQYLYIKKCEIELLDDLYSVVPQLEYLHITDNKIGEINCNALLKLENLKYLSLFGTETSSIINYEDFKKLPNLEIILFDTAVYKNLNFSLFPNLKKIQIGSYVNAITVEEAITEEETVLIEKIKNLNLEFELHYCGPITIDLSKVMICA